MQIKKSITYLRTYVVVVVVVVVIVIVINCFICMTASFYSIAKACIWQSKYKTKQH